MGNLVEVLVPRDIGGDRPRTAAEQRVTVRRRLGGVGAAGVAAGPGPVFDNDRLTQGLRHSLKQDAADDIARATAGEWHDRCDRPCRVVLRTRRAGKKASQSQSGAGQEAISCNRHCLSFDVREEIPLPSYFYLAATLGAVLRLIPSATIRCNRSG